MTTAIADMPRQSTVNCVVKSKRPTLNGFEATVLASTLEI